MENERKFGGAIGRKYARIDLSGREALRSGEINEFKGFSEDFERRFNVWIGFTPESNEEVTERLTKPLETIERDLSLKLFLGGRDYSIHATLMQGDSAEELEVGKRAEIRSILAHDTELRATSEELKGLHLPFKYVLIDKGNVLLNVANIPSVIERMRATIADAFGRNKLRPVPIENILHMSMARITGLPKEGREDVLREYMARMIILRHEISRNPIEAIVQDINVNVGGIAKGGESTRIV